MKKLIYATAAILLVAGLAAAPAFAQGAMAKMPMKGHRTANTAHSADAAPSADSGAMKSMPMKAHHAKSCYDQAWESQAQKDCLAGKPAMSAAKKSTKKAAAAKS